MKALKGLLSILLVLIMVVSFASFIGSEPVLAKDELKDKKIEKEVLQIDEVRLDKHIKAKVVKEFEVEGVKYTQYTAEVSSLPETLDDLETVITCEWRPGRGLDGVDYLVNGNNLYWARVTGTRVSVEYENKQAAWDPQIIIGGNYLELKSGPIVTADPINAYYTENTVKWVYEWSTGGILGIGAQTITITRYLRQIEGCLLEYFILDEDPRGDVQIKQNYKSEKGFKWDRPVSAWDADNNSIEIEETRYGKLVKASQLFGRTYPVTIDPTTSFITSASDGVLSRDDDYSWSTARTASSAEEVRSSWSTLKISTNSSSGGDYFDIDRSYLFLDTSELPDSATIEDAVLNLYVYDIYWDEDDGEVWIVSGMETYPHDPLVLADYNYTNYGSFTSDYGNADWSSSFTEGNYEKINVNNPAALKGIVNKTGYTKLCLIERRDKQNESPWGPCECEGGDTADCSNEMRFYAYEAGTGYQPKLEVTYTIPVEIPEAQTNDATDVVDTYATLHGMVVDDGYTACSVRFKYGTSTGVYPNASAWQEGKYTDDTFYATVYGLSKGTKHYFVAEVSNSAGSDLGSEKVFLTKPGNPSGFSATPGNGENALAWTKGTGATKTLIRFKTTGYPTSVTDGTQCYFDTGVSYDHTSLDNGTTYYYSAWAYTASGELTQYSLGYVTTSGKPVYTGAPLVTTNSATDVEQTTATLHGYLDSLSGYGSADVWFQYYTGAGTWTDNETAPETLTATGAFSKAITSLTTDTLYHMRAAAVGTGGTTYGSDIPFTTNAACAPTMTTQAATGVTMTNATLHGKVTSDGGAVVTAWFEWDLTTDYGYSTASASGLETDDTIYVSLVDLPPSTEHHFRIVGENSAGINYGADLNFTTDSPTAPTCTTQDATSVGATSATLHGTVTSDGGVASEVRFQYGLTDAYGTDTGWMSGYYTNDTFEFLIIGLDQGETYHYRGQVKNITNTGSGADKTFETQFGPPTEFKADAVSPTSVTVSWENIGDQTAVFAKRGSFPSDRLDGEQVYFGTGESCGHGELASGATYFYRAWSWKEGGVYSEGYSEDATTTMVSIPGEVPGFPGEDIVGDTPVLPEDWFQEPSGDALADWPFHYIVEDVAADMEITPGSLWIVLAMVGLAVIGLAVFLISGNLLVVILSTGGVLVLLVGIGLMPLWILLGLIVIGGSLAYLTRQGV